eukprot:2706582-Pyramimonas_sp.AAC.1
MIGRCASAEQLIKEWLRNAGNKPAGGPLRRAAGRADWVDGSRDGIGAPRTRPQLARNGSRT